MNIAVIGFGRMGHMIKNTAEQKGHHVVTTIDVAAPDADVHVSAGDGAALARAVKAAKPDGIIEFSHPSAVIGNITAVLPLGIPMVVGTTGWNERESEIRALAEECGGVLMHSANFSIGVHLFCKIVEEAARLLQPFGEYDTAVWEMHHNQKADSPSGTALEIARHIMKSIPEKTEIESGAFHQKPAASQLHVSSTRCGSVPGTHTVFFDSPADTIELTHRARSREGFAVGAVTALERLVAGVASGSLKRGHLYGMDDIF